MAATPTSAERAPHRGKARDQALVATEHAVVFPPSFNKREADPGKVTVKSSREESRAAAVGRICQPP
jgi:hypothetical protein